MIGRSSMRGAWVLFAAVLPACGLENGIVGGVCRDGLVNVGNACVSPSTGPNAPAPSGATGTDTSVAARSGGDAEPGTAAGAVATLPSWGTASPAATSLGSALSGSDPTPGTDGAAAGTPPALVGLTCAPPLVACHGECISVENDPANCGACGKTCPSNICLARECQGATPGDVVLIGHDFTDAWAGSTHAKVLVNAVSIPTTDPIRILSYERTAAYAGVAQARALIADGIRDRAVVYTDADDGALESSSLALSYDVVLIHDAAGADPGALGARWSDSLERFTKKGGLVVALDRGMTKMPELLRGTRLLSIDSHVSLAWDTRFSVDAPADVVGTQLLSPYAARGQSVGFVTAPAPDTSWVVRELTANGPGLPSVIHKTVR
jgi:hypothetical protein